MSANSTMMNHSGDTTKGDHPTRNTATKNDTIARKIVFTVGASQCDECGHADDCNVESNGFNRFEYRLFFWLHIAFLPRCLSKKDYRNNQPRTLATGRDCITRLIGLLLTNGCSSHKPFGALIGLGIADDWYGMTSRREVSTFTEMGSAGTGSGIIGSGEITCRFGAMTSAIRSRVQ